MCGNTAEVSETGEPARIGSFDMGHPLTVGCLRQLVRGLDLNAYPDECPVDVHTPISPDRRCVGFKVRDYTTTTEESETEK